MPMMPSALHFRTMDSLLQKSTAMQYRSVTNEQKLADAFFEFLITKIENIRVELLAMKGDLGAFSNIDS